jgi:outer membrane protein assembly factor BamB
MLQMAGLPLAPAQHADGASLVPLLERTGPLERDALFWHYPHYGNQGGFPGSAVRMGRYKLIESFEDERLQLFDLEVDLGERRDLADEMPDRVREMHEVLRRWRSEVDAKLPTPNPEYGRDVLLQANSSRLLRQEGMARFNWPSFRGPHASGIADGQDPPLTWDAESGGNVLWRTPIPGLGHSSPVVWGDRIFLTTAVSADPDSVFRYGTDGRQDRRSDRSSHVWQVYAIDRRSGEVVWVREPSTGSPSVQRHPKNSYATATPATDGEHVVALIATGGLSAYDFEGNLLWEAELGPLDAGASYDGAYQWGAASSPIIWDGLVIVQADQQEGSFIAAFDIDTGEEVWRTQRELISSFSTPTIHVGRERAELVTNGAGTMFGYDPRSGEELWRMSGSSLNTTPTPVSSGETIFVTSGYRTRPIFAVREGASGDISLAQGESSNEHVAWSSPRDGPYIASPLAYRGFLYVVSANGVLTVFDAATGERAYKRRVADTGGAYSASPVAADGRIYLTSEDGDVFVLRAGPEYELLASNRMNEVCLATPAISEGQMFIRTTSHLYALEAGIAPSVVTAEDEPLPPFPSEYGPDLVLRFDDFEDRDLIANTGVRWQTFTNGVSTASLQLVDGGAAGTTTAARLEGELALGAARGPLAQMYLPFDRGAVTADLSNLGGVRFWARGSGTIDLSFNCRAGGSGIELDVSGEWRLIEVEVDEMTATFGEPARAPWDGAECVGLYLSRRSAANTGAFWFEIDELVLYGADAWR